MDIESLCWKNESSSWVIKKVKNTLPCEYDGSYYKIIFLKITMVLWIDVMEEC